VKKKLKLKGRFSNYLVSWPTFHVIYVFLYVPSPCPPLLVGLSYIQVNQPFSFLILPSLPDRERLPATGGENSEIGFSGTQEEFVAPVKSLPLFDRILGMTEVDCSRN